MLTRRVINHNISKHGFGPERLILCLFGPKKWRTVSRYFSFLINLWSRVWSRAILCQFSRAFGCKMYFADQTKLLVILPIVKYAVCNLLSPIHCATWTQQQLNATPDLTTLKIVQCEFGISSKIPSCLRLLVEFATILVKAFALYWINKK